MLRLLLQYNWQVRDEWFSLLEHIPRDELLRGRIGGVGSILQTLFHQNWKQFPRTLSEGDYDARLMDQD